MKNDQGFANLIYEYFVVRFHFQYYKYGDTLPTIEALCRQYSVSSLTIKSAFKRLEEEGYISRSHGRSARVLFRCGDKDLDEFAVHFFSERREGIPDLYQSTELIFLPMLTKGLMLMEEKDFVYLENLAKQTVPEDQIRFYCFILQKTRNPLIMNLFWESTLYMGLPFPILHRGTALYDAEASRQRLTDLIDGGRQRDPERICEAHIAFQRDVSKKIIGYINSRLPAIPDKKQVPFLWNIYRDRPQICCGLAIRIIHDVYMGDFQDMEFLPSYEKMAQRYQVSVSTMRRTVSLLNSLGATQSVNGKGTRVLLLSGSGTQNIPDLTPPAIRRNLAYYIQSFELLAESCKNVMGFVFKAFSEEEKAELSGILERYLRSGRYFISAQSIFAFAAEHSPLQVIQDIYGKLYGLNLWGYPMKVYRLRMPGLNQTMIQFTNNILGRISQNDADGFASAIGEFMKNEYDIAVEILLEHGFTKEELYLSPSFSLLETDII